MRTVWLSTGCLSAFEYLRNARLQARNVFASSVPHTVYNQFGVAGGGRIIPDKLFVFGDYQGSRDVNGTSSLPTIPTLPFRLYGLTTLPAPASAAEQQALDLETTALLNSNDAVADLALAEGVYQAVQGNYDRVASTVEAYPDRQKTMRESDAGGLSVNHAGFRRKCPCRVWLGSGRGEHYYYVRVEQGRFGRSDGAGKRREHK